MFVSARIYKLFWYLTFGLSLFSTMIKTDRLKVYVTGKETRTKDLRKVMKQGVWQQKVSQLCIKWS